MTLLQVVVYSKLEYHPWSKTLVISSSYICFHLITAANLWDLGTLRFPLGDIWESERPQVRGKEGVRGIKYSKARSLPPPFTFINHTCRSITSNVWWTQILKASLISWECFKTFCTCSFFFILSSPMSCYKDCVCLSRWHMYLDTIHQQCIFKQNKSVVHSSANDTVLSICLDISFPIVNENKHFL